MSASVLTVLIGWLIALAIFFGFIVLLRYVDYKERLEMLRQGFAPTHMGRRKSGRMLRAGLITAMVGLTLTIGLYPIGFFLPITFPATPFHLGPWLLPGLIPLGVGVALISSYYLERDVTTDDVSEHEQERGKKHERDQAASATDADTLDE